jgi:hypothetical protein
MLFHTLRYITDIFGKTSLCKPIFIQSKLEVWCAVCSETTKNTWMRIKFLHTRSAALHVRNLKVNPASTVRL